MILSTVPCYIQLSCLLQVLFTVTVSQSFLVFDALKFFRLLARSFVDIPLCECDAYLMMR